MIKMIDRYQIQAEIGSGSFGTVYRANDSKLKREVAVKVLHHRGLNDPNFRMRFEREAQILANLEHSAIVPVFDYGEVNGQPYFVMRIMEGGSLKQQLKNGPMPLHEIARILSRISSALDVSHAKGIIHRDIKPDNILFDTQGDAYLADFGIAKWSDTSHSLTKGMIIGTPAYMSPEQALAKEQIDEKSDVYSLGTVLFQMLTGETPYESDSTLGMAMAHVNEPVPSILDVKQDLPYGCEAIITKAMSKDPADRYDNVTELAKEFQQALQAPSPPPLPTALLSSPSLSASASPSPPQNKFNWKALVWKIGGAIIAGYLGAWLGVFIQGATGGIGAYIGFVLGLIIWGVIVSRVKR